MSRIGKAAIAIPSGVEVKLSGSQVSVKGAKGQLEATFPPQIKAVLSDGQLKFERPDESKDSRSLHGLVRALVNNMVMGVTDVDDKIIIRTRQINELVADGWDWGRLPSVHCVRCA